MLALAGALLLVRQLFRSFVIAVVLLGVAWQRPETKIWVWTKALEKEMTKQPMEFPALASGASPQTLPPAPASAAELFRTTTVWEARLRFTTNEWDALTPERVPPLLGFLRPDGSAVLRNPAASRAGLAGALGIDLPWSRGALEFSGRSFTNIAARFKGNGTFLASLKSYKRPFKLDLNKHVAGQRLAGRANLNFHNLVADPSYVSDALACRFFRDAGVPAPRTTFVRLRLSVAGRFEDRLLGLYVMVENPDAEWARERFGTKGVALFKPVTPDLFSDLGKAWTNYAQVYDPKTPTTPAQQQRLMELARLVSYAPDQEFARRIGEFVDLDEFAAFLAGQVLLANYDSILSNGQNFLMYLDPRTDRFGFIPWDHDHSWGQFPLVGTAAERAHASIWHPWVGRNRFLERMLAAPTVRTRYEATLRRLRDELFQPERLGQQLDELATTVRPFIAEESADRLAHFERTVAEIPEDDPERTYTGAMGRPAYSFKQFFAQRAKSVSDQLGGREQGVTPPRMPVY